MTQTLLTVEKIIPPLLKYGREIMLESWTPDSCIAAARICHDVLLCFELNCRVETCRTFVATNNLWQRIDDGVPINNKFGPGEHSVGIGFEELAAGPDRLPCHVISRCGDWFIDLSLDQASRPPLMPVEPFAFRLERNERWPGQVRRKLNSRAQVMYQPKRGPDRFLSTSPDWYKRERFRVAVPRIVEAIRENAAR